MMDTVALLSTIALRATALLFAVSLVVLFLRNRTAASRHLAWAVGFVGLAALPWMVLYMPSREFARPVPVESPHKIVTAAPKPTDVDRAPDVADGSPQTAPSPSPAPTPKPFPWSTILLSIYGLGVGISLLGTAIRLAAARRLVRRSNAPESPILKESLDTARRLIWDGASPRIESRIADVQVPMTLGFLRPVVLLPNAAVDWPQGTLDAVMRHECAHIRRHDWATMVFARLVRALYWFHPLAWWAEASLRAESEAAADDLVILAGTDAPDYAKELIDLAAGLGPRASRTEALAIVERSNLKDRIKGILGRGRRGRPIRARVTAGVALTCLAGVSVLACSRLTRGPDLIRDGHYDLGNGHWVEILAITDMNGSPRSWNAKGELLREPLPVTGFARDAANHDSEGKPRPMTPNTRYVLFRTDMDGDVGLEASLADDGHSELCWPYEYPGPRGYAYQFQSIDGGACRLQRLDFPSGQTGAFHAWVAAGPYRRIGIQGRLDGVEKAQGLLPVVTLAGYGSNVSIDLPDSLSSEQAMLVTHQGKEVIRRQLPRYATGKQSVSITAEEGAAITCVEALARPVKHVLFDDVPLQPKPGSIASDDLAGLPNLRRATGAVGTFADGSKVEFAGLVDPQHADSARWTPDGSPDLKSADLKQMAHSSYRYPVMPTDRAVTIVFRIPKNQLNFREVYDQSGLAYRMQGTIGATTPRQQDLMAYCLVLDKGTRTSSVVLKKPIGAPRVVDSHELESAGDYRAWFVASDPQMDRKPSLHVVLPVAVLAQTAGMDTDIECLDAQGKTIPWQMRSGPTSDTGEVAFVYTKEQADRAKTIRVSTRQYGYLEFSNVQFWQKS